MRYLTPVGISAVSAVLLLAAAFSLLVAPISPVSSSVRAAAVEPGTAAFDRTWARTDQPVAEQVVERTWMWGPQANTGVLIEEYDEAPGGERAVQYFDKSRMEDNAYRETAPWDVTNGLLVSEMIAGRIQLGDNRYDDSPQPADVNIAGDPGEGPTYADIAECDLLSTEGVDAGDVGMQIGATLAADCEIGFDAGFLSTNVTAAVYVPETGHTIASPFWAFMNATGTTWSGSAYVEAPLFENAFYATGYPLTEAYWSVIKVGGAEMDVLWQCFERRCLTYTPDNAPLWQVEAGNVGQHYYQWRYQDTAPSPTATVTTTATVPSTSTSVATVTETSTSPGQATSTATNTPTNTPTSTPTNTPTNTPTSTPTRPSTSTPTNTPTNTPIATSTTPSTGGGTAASCLDPEEATFLRLLNEYRVSNGLQPLTVSKKLNIASHKHSYDMATNNFFSHTGSDGSNAGQRISREGYTGNSTWAENIAKGYRTGSAVFEGWKGSAGHRANMLNPNYTQIGIGFVQVSGGSAYWTTDFANGNDAAPSC